MEEARSEMEEAKKEAETKKKQISEQATKHVEDLKNEMTQMTAQEDQEAESKRTEKQKVKERIKDAIWSTIPNAGTTDSYVKTSSLKAMMKVVAGYLSQLPQSADPDSNEIYKGSRDMMLQQLIGLKQENTEIKCEAVDRRLENLEAKTAIAKLEIKTQSNHNDIKSIKRNGCTRGQVHNIVRRDVEEGKVITLRRLFEGDIQRFKSWCSLTRIPRTQMVFDYLVEQYDLNGDDANGNDMIRKNQLKEEFWDKAADVLVNAVPIELHKDIKVGGAVNDSGMPDDAEINTDIKLYFEDRKDARWVHNRYCSQLGDKKMRDKPPMIFEGREGEKREDNVKTGKDYENTKWLEACRSVNEQVITALGKAEDLEKVSEWIKRDSDICQKVPEILYLREEERRKGLDTVDGKFRIYTAKAPVGEDVKDEQTKEYASLCRNSILHAMRLATRLLADPDLETKTEYSEDTKKSARLVLEAFQMTTGLVQLKSFLGLTKTLNTQSEQ